MLVAAAFLCAGSTPAFAQDDGKKDLMKDVKAAQDAMRKAAKPGPEHAILARMAGTWKAVTRDFAAPGKPRVSEGTATMTMILGGRFLMHEFSGTSHGKPFEGMGISGYDNVKQKYVDIWMDDMMTSISVMEGTYDPKTRIGVSQGDVQVPGGGTVKMRGVSKEVSDDERFFEMFVTGPKGKEKKVFEITYTRVTSQ